MESDNEVKYILQKYKNLRIDTRKYQIAVVRPLLMIFYIFERARGLSVGQKKYEWVSSYLNKMRFVHKSDDKAK